MKAKRAITDLGAKAAGVTFPTAQHDFNHFTSDLRALVRENFGYDAAHGLTFDEHDGYYFWEQSEFVGVLADGMGVKADVQFVIDPKKPLLDEFTAVEKRLAEFADRKRALGRALLGIGGRL